VTEQLIRDAGYEPINTGGLENARAIEDHVALFSGVTRGGRGPAFYRYARPGDL
jgi:predicted dinucleotide-binding enzyme